jgi:6-phosphogluconolactonase (cycloisomerase 2 family)
MGENIVSALGACMKRLIGFTAALCLLAIMVGCGGVTSTGTLAYVSNSATNSTGFTVFTVNTDGTLTKSNISPQNVPEPPKMLQFSPNGKWAFYLDATGSNVFAYTRAGNGTLSVKIDSYPVGPGASSLVVAPSNNFLYVALPATQELAIFSIDPSTGILAQVGQNLLVGYDLEQLVLAPNGVLFGLSTLKQAVIPFTLTASTGVATQQIPTPVGQTPSFLVLSANGQYAYVLDASSVFPIPGTALSTPNIFGFTVGSTGTLTPMPDSPFQENADSTGHYPASPFGGVVSNDNRYLYVANKNSHNISVFKITSTNGELQEVLGSTSIINGVSVSSASPFDCGTGCSTPSYVSITNGNNGLFVVDPNAGTNKAGAIFQFQIDQNTGKLRPQNPASVVTEGSPTWITIR